MATTFPTALDAFTNPAAATQMDASAALNHDVQHTNANDAIAALQAKVGIDASANVNSLDYLLAGVRSWVGIGTIAANLIFAGPTNGVPANPTWRALVAADLPNHSTALLTSGTLGVARGGTGASGASVTAGFVLAAPSGAAGAVSYRALVASDLPSFGTAAAGIVPASGGGTANYLRADGTWATPPGGSSLPGLATTGITGNLTLTKTGTTAQTATFPDATFTVAGLQIAQTFTAAQTFTQQTIIAGISSLWYMRSIGDLASNTTQPGLSSGGTMWRTIFAAGGIFPSGYCAGASFSSGQGGGEYSFHLACGSDNSLWVNRSADGAPISLSGWRQVPALDANGNLGVGTAPVFRIHALRNDAADCVVLSQQSGSQGAFFKTSAGNGTTSNRYSCDIYEALETSPQSWYCGMVGTKDWQIYNATAGISPIVVENATATVRLYGTVPSVSASTGTLVIQNGGLGVAQGIFAGGSGFFGNASAPTSVEANGSASGTGGGARLGVRNNGASNLYIGNYSAIHGSAYDPRPAIWGNASLILGHAGNTQFFFMTGGTATFGTDPGGSEMLRVGGGGRFSGTTYATNLVTTSSTISGGAGNLDVLTGAGRMLFRDNGGQSLDAVNAASNAYVDLNIRGLKINILSTSGNTYASFPNPGAANSFRVENGATAAFSEARVVAYSANTSGSDIQLVAQGGVGVLTNTIGAGLTIKSIIGGSTSSEINMLSSGYVKILGAASNVLDVQGGMSTTGICTLGTIGTTFAGNVIAGCQTGAAQISGQVGERITANASLSYAASNAFFNVCSITLTPGVWMISAFAMVQSGATGFTAGSTAELHISTSATTGGAYAVTQMRRTVPTLIANQEYDLAIPFYERTITATTTYYLNSFVTYASGSPTINGRIQALRIR